MKKIILSLFLSGICLLGMSQKSQIGLPITWDDTTNVDYTTIGFGSDTAFLAADPSDSTNIVLEVLKPSGAQTWAGMVLGNDSLNAAIPFAVGSTSIRARIYSIAVGQAMRMKVENESNGGISVETEVLTTVVGWDTLTFDFSNNVANTPAINFSNTYDKLVIFFGFGVSPAANETYYIDYVAFGGGSSGPSKALISLPITWDDTANVDYTVSDFGGNGSMLTTDPTNAANLVIQSIKDSTAQLWAGTSFGNALGVAIPFVAGNTTVRARVYSPDTGIEIRLKVEDQSDPTKSVETVDTTTVVGWDTLSFDFSVQAAGTAAINYSYTFDKMSIFYNFGVTGANAGVKTYYVDYVEFVGPAAASKAQIDLPITWDDSSNVDYSVIDFGGNGSMLAADPSNSSNIVLQSVKDSAAQVWAGTTFGSSLATAIPFSVGNTIISARVYSPAVGIVVKMKAEDQTNGSLSVETDVTTTQIGWEILTFNFVNNSVNTPVINFGTTYDKLSIFYNFGVSPAAAEMYYVDDVVFGMLTAVKSPIALPITWDDSSNVNYSVTDFGGNGSMLAADPLNPLNTVLQSVKDSAAQVWAGTTFGNSLASAIPFSAGNTIISARVYSSAVGVVVKMKAEDQTNGALSVETDVTTTQIGWDTLTFNFTNNSANTPGINFMTTYDRLSIFYNFGVSPTTAETYYVDNVSFGQLATGIQENRTNATFTVYPNPASAVITIDASLLNDVNQIIVTNSIGQVVLQKNVSALDNKIDVANFDNGVYFMILSSESGIKTSKFMVAK